MTPLSILSLAPESKAQVESFISYFIDELESGELDSLKVLMLIKGFEKAFEGISEAIKKDALCQLQKYGLGSHQMQNFVLSVFEAGTKYDYENTGDPIVKRLAEQLKERQEMLKKITGHVLVQDPETGEETKVYRAAKKSTTSIKLELK